MNIQSASNTPRRRTDQLYLHSLPHHGATQGREQRHTKMEAAVTTLAGLPGNGGFSKFSTASRAAEVLRAAVSFARQKMQSRGKQMSLRQVDSGTRKVHGWRT